MSRNGGWFIGVFINDLSRQYPLQVYLTCQTSHEPLPFETVPTNSYQSPSSTLKLSPVLYSLLRFDHLYLFPLLLLLYFSHFVRYKRPTVHLVTPVSSSTVLVITIVCFYPTLLSFRQTSPVIVRVVTPWPEPLLGSGSAPSFPYRLV